MLVGIFSLLPWWWKWEFSLLQLFIFILYSLICEARLSFAAYQKYILWFFSLWWLIKGDKEIEGSKHERDPLHTHTYIYIHIHISESDVTYSQVWWPILRIHALHLPMLVHTHGEQLGVQCLAQGNLVVVLTVERVLYIHSPHLQFLPDRDSNSQPFD